GAATIAPGRGIFLPTSYRMHADVCRFISEAVYDARLAPEPANQNQRLVLKPDAHAAQQPTGIRFLPLQLPMPHAGNSQKSPGEAALVRELYADLLRHAWRNAPSRCARRHHRQIPGPGSRSRPYFHDNLERRALTP
ncbi:MAG: AAA domain-containing protein, partial [Fimbriimonadaceae bacterium]